MPTYEYACKDCDEHLEVYQSFADAALTECPACGGRLRKVFGNIAIAFKGSGFYKTDSRDGGMKGAKAKDGEGTASSGEKSEKSEKSEKTDKSGKSGTHTSSSSESSSTSSSSATPAAAAS